MDSLVFFKWDFKKLIQKGMVMIMTKQEKIERFRKMNETIEKGQIVCAGSSLMEMFPVEKFVQEDKLDLVIYNRGIGGFVTQELLDNIDVCILDLEPRRLFINIGTNDLSDPAISIASLPMQEANTSCYRFDKCSIDQACNILGNDQINRFLTLRFKFHHCLMILTLWTVILYFYRPSAIFPVIPSNALDSLCRFPSGSAPISTSWLRLPFKLIVNLEKNESKDTLILKP